MRAKVEHSECTDLLFFATAAVMACYKTISPLFFAHRMPWRFSLTNQDLVHAEIIALRECKTHTVVSSPLTEAERNETPHSYLAI